MSFDHTHGMSPGPTRSRGPIFAIATLVLCAGVGWIFLTNLGLVSLELAPLWLSATLIIFLSTFDLRVGLAALLIAIGLSPEFEVYGVQNLRYEDMLVPFFFLIWLSQFVLHRNKLQQADIKTPILLIVFLTLISSLSNHLYQGLDLEHSVFRFGKSISYYLIFLMVLNTLRNKNDIRTFAMLMIAASAFVGLYGLTEIVQQAGISPDDDWRIVGPPGETANILGGYFVFHICLALGAHSKAGTKGKTLLMIYLIFMAVPFVLTLSRTSYVALMIGILTIWAFSRNHAAGWVLIAFALGVLLAPSYVLERLTSIAEVFSGENASLNARTGGWTIFIPAALQSPILGRGVGSRSLGHVDSEYVLQLNDLGIIGLFAFLVLLFRCVRTGYRLFRKETEDTTLQGFALGYFGGCIALMVHSLAATTFTTIRTTEPFFFATGLIYALANLRGVTKSSSMHAEPELGTSLKRVRPENPFDARARAAQEFRDKITAKQRGLPGR